MKVLVTGSAGFIAQALMRRLTDAGYAVSGLDKDPSATSHYVLSILDAATLKIARSECARICLLTIRAPLLLLAPRAPRSERRSCY